MPTNLRAVKKAAKEMGLQGVLARRNKDRVGNPWINTLNSQANAESTEMASGFADFILDYENETLGRFLK